MSETSNPTRMELLKIKNRIKLAEKGHKLLKQKRDFLVMEFLNLLEETKLLRGELHNKLRNSYNSLAVAESYHSIFELESATLSISQVLGVKMKQRNVMGVKIPVITKFFTTRDIGKRGYTIIGSSAKIDAVSTEFEKALDAIIDIAETEISIRKLVLEIEKTKRRVNALEYTIIPDLTWRKKDIEFRLDEMERDNFVTLKALKAVLNPSENW